MKLEVMLLRKFANAIGIFLADWYATNRSLRVLDTDEARAGEVVIVRANRALNIF